MSDDASDPPPLRLLALVAPTLTVAYLAALPIIFVITALTPDAPQKAAEAVSQPADTLAHVSRVKPLLANLKRLKKPVKHGRPKR